MNSRQRQKLAIRLRKTQGDRCCYCEIRMRPMPHPTGPLSDDAETIEHLQRKEDGGRDNIDNLALACHRCNTGRGSVDWLTYKSYRMGELPIFCEAAA